VPAEPILLAAGPQGGERAHGRVQQRFKRQRGDEKRRRRFREERGGSATGKRPRSAIASAAMAMIAATYCRVVVFENGALLTRIGGDVTGSGTGECVAMLNTRRAARNARPVNCHDPVCA